MKLIENSSQDFLCDLAAPLQGMPAIHEHFRFNDRNQSALLTQRGIASQRVRVGLDAAAAGNSFAHGNHGTPLGKTGAHPRVFSQAIAQSVQTFRDLFCGMACQLLCAHVNFDAGDDSRIGDGFDEERAIFRPLADRLVVENCAANGLAKTGRGHNQFPIGAPGLLGLRDPQLCKTFVTGWIAFIHRQQAFVAGDHRFRGVFKVLRIHLVVTPFPDSPNHLRASAVSA